MRLAWLSPRAAAASRSAGAELSERGLAAAARPSAGARVGAAYRCREAVRVLREKFGVALRNCLWSVLYNCSFLLMYVIVRPSVP